MDGGSESTVDPQPRPWGFRFGRQPHDPARIAAAPSLLRYALAGPPASLDRSGIDFQPLLGGNDRLPDCTAVAIFNAAAAAGRVIGGYAPAIDEAMAPQLYAETIGRPDASDAELAATDGAQILDALGHARVPGVEIGQQQRLVADFGTAPVSRASIAFAAANLGACVLGVRLYARDMDMIGGLLDVAGDPGELAGGHAVIVWDYSGLADTDTVRIGTWGAWQRATWAWVLARSDEAHGMAFRQLDPPGLDHAGLRANVEGYIA